VNHALSQLAKKFKATKFLRIVATDAIPNYPDKNVPTLLVYFEGNPRANIVGVSSMGGMDLKADGGEQPSSFALSHPGLTPFVSFLFFFLFFLFFCRC